MRKFFTGLLLLVLVSMESRGGQSAIYVDSGNLQTGDGSLANPYNRLSLINWPSVSNQIAVGNSVSINLKSGSTFRETFTVGASGTSNAPLVIQSYGAGNLPVIACDKVISGWTSSASSAGQVWSAPYLGTVNYLWINQTNLSKGTNLSTLNNWQWITANNSVYLRYDLGNPDQLGATVTTASLVNAVLLASRSNVRLDQIAFRNSSSYLITMPNSSSIDIRRCLFSQAAGFLDLTSSTNARLSACTFDECYSNPGIKVAGNTSAAFYFCQIHSILGGDAIDVLSGQQLAFVNCNFIGCRSRAIYNSSSANLSFLNCLFSGIGISPDVLGNETIYNSGGSCSIGNSLVLPNGQNPIVHLTNTIDLGGNLYRDPKFKQTRREGIMAIVEDDFPTQGDWSNLAQMAAGYGWRITLALDNTDGQVAGNNYAMLQQRINEGHEVVSHTRSHPKLIQLQAMNLQYTGNGSACSFSVSNNFLDTVVTGGLGNENIHIDLTAPTMTNVNNLVSSIASKPAYSCSLATTYNGRVYARLLQATNGVDIKSAPYAVPFDKGKFYTNEIFLSKADIESRFTASNGGPYQCKCLVYPGGYYDDEVINNALAAGFSGARMDSPASGAWQMSSFDLYKSEVVSGTVNGDMLTLPFESGSGDYSPRLNNFNSSNLVLATPAYRLSFCAKFNGTNTFLVRATNPDFDFSKGDWHASVHVWPSKLQNLQTLYSAGSDASNCFRIYLDTQGAVHVDVTDHGTPSVALATPAGAINTNGWQKISVQELFDRWMIRINDVLLVDVVNTNRLRGYSGNVYVGCTPDFAAGINKEFYGGLMDDFAMSNGTYYKIQAAADVACEAGGFFHLMSHGETGCPREIWRIVLDALKDYSGRLRVLTGGDSIDYVRTNGTLQADGRTVVRTDWTGRADYNLRADSPCVGAGANQAVAGIPDLVDVNGLPVTDHSGQLLVAGGRISIGAMQPQLQITSSNAFSGTQGQNLNITLSAVGGVGNYTWALTANSPLPPAGLSLSAAGQLIGILGVSGPFSFVVEVTDQNGQKAQQTTTLNISGSPLTTYLRPLGIQPDRSFGLTISATSNVVATIQTSSNLVDWFDSGTVTLSNGMSVWSNNIPDNLPNGFYRARVGN